jgi:uncharacterized protein with von Willebrand factor type A (vWA) domain
MVSYRYSEWDGSQELPELNADEVLEGLTDDLMNFGDLQHALRNLLSRGMRGSGMNRMQGLRDLLQQLRQQKRQMLDRYNLNSVFDDLKRRLNDIIQRERETLEQRMREAENVLQDDADGSAQAQQGGAPQPESGEASAAGRPQAMDGGQDGEQGGEQAGAEAGAQTMGQQGAQQAGRRGQSGQKGQQSGGDMAEQQRQLAQMLRNMVNRKQDFLDKLPTDLGGAVRELQNYEFMDPEAQAQFQELMESLKKAMMETFFKDIYQQIQNMSPEDLARLKQMVRDLNRMLQEKMAGGQPDFDQFMQQYGDLFGNNPPESLDDLIRQMQQQMAMMQNLLDSMGAEQRRQLADLLNERIGDPELQDELAELQANLEYMFPMRDLRNQYPFRGDEELDLQAAMQVMERMQGMDEIERQLDRAQYGGDLDEIDAEKLRELLGDEAYETLNQLKQLLKVLEDAGYIRRRGNAYELTPRGTRKIGQKALAEIYGQLKKDSFGKHPIHDRGAGGERSDETKSYEFGDPFHLNLQETIFNSFYREKPSVPVRLHSDDFAVYRSEALTQTATVMMLDLSWSMALRGSFQAAKKVALALNNLIRSQYTRDSLYIIGFSAYARELRAEDLPYQRWDESVLGTNMHHALILAQSLLAKHKVGTRQIIMISDGEPTAHLERGRSYFAYPPSPVTIRETLKEVKRCTQKGIIINTFMLDRNYYLKEFVNQVARINKGRVFYTTPDKLGQYILVDYVSSKRKAINSR